MNIFGVVIAYWMELYVSLSLARMGIPLFTDKNSGLSFIDGGKSAFRWRFPVAFQIIFLLMLFSMIWFFPESPRWLVKVGRDDEARYILGRLRGSTTPEERARADLEFREISHIAELEKSMTHDHSYLAMLFGYKSGKLHLGRRVQLVIWLQIMQEWTGIAGVTVCMFLCLYLVGPLGLLLMFLIDAPTIFSIAGYNAEKSQWISGLNNIFYMVCEIFATETRNRLLIDQ